MQLSVLKRRPSQPAWREPYKTLFRAVIAAVASVTESGRGAFALEDGSFLDVAMVEGARKTLALAERS
jgi:hypothetical protein